MNIKFLLPGLAMLCLTACFEDKWKDQDNDSSTPPPATQPNEATLTAFDPDDELMAKIRWTEYGVPHIEADNLESLGFGTAYAYARDNYCTLAEQMVKIRSERSKYFGPDKIAGSGDSANLISDFGFKALALVDSATLQYPSFSDNTRALLKGYAAGFNKYLDDIGAVNLAPECANADWIEPLTPAELAAYYVSINMQTSGAQSSYMEMAFYANPGDDAEFMPYPSAQTVSLVDHDIVRLQPTMAFSKPNDTMLGSNAWALGSSMTENGQGALLGNPHFPLVGNLRFWQSHLTIPGVLNVTGGSLQGYPIVQMGFNEDIAWTHTVSTAEHFVLYELALDGNRTSYSVDGESRPIQSRTYTIEVNIGDGVVIEFSKDYFYSHHGLMIEAPPETFPLGWGDNTAYTLRDATADSWDSIDHWLGINLATDLSEFQQTYKDYDGVTFVNTLYADKAGHSFYIDNSSVLNFNDMALDLMRNDPVLAGTHEAYELFVLPGDTTLFEPNGINSYEQSPKIQRNDYVQNANDSYWATNLTAPLAEYSILYGQDYSPLSLRTRLSLAMLNDSSGSNGTFSVEEIEDALLSNRVYLGELVLNDLLAQCHAQGATPVELANGQFVNISDACITLSNWDGLMNKNSRGAHLFREFAFKFNPYTQLSEPYDPADPANTPNTLTTDSSSIQSFAAAVANLQAAGIDPSAALGDIQFYEKTLAGGTGTGTRLSWAGPNEIEGGFNIFSSGILADTLAPINSYTPAIDAETGLPMWSGLTTEGYQVQYGSTWMFVVNFTEDGPQARGLLTNSQSADSESPHFDDQSQYYSENVSLRPIRFSEADIQQNTAETLYPSL